MCAVWSSLNKGKPLGTDLGDLSVIAGRIDNVENGLNGVDTLDSVKISGGSIDGVGIGAITPATAKVTELTADNIKIDGNSITSEDTDGDINLVPNGTGEVVIPANIAPNSINVGGGGAFKTKLLTANTAAAGSTVIAHGLTYADIVGLTGRVNSSSSFAVFLNSEGLANGVSTQFDATNSTIFHPHAQYQGQLYRIIIFYV